MLTRREVVIEKPFRDRRYKNHRRKVKSAVPRIDTVPPPTYIHLDIKMKKLRLEVDRQNRICHDNIGLLHRMAIIMRTKRMDDINNLPKGPFEKRKNLRPMTTMARTRISKSPYKENNKSPYKEINISPYKGNNKSSYSKQPSFLEAITKEATKRNPISHQSKAIEHRAPHGFCKVPKLGLPSIMSPPISQYSQHFPKAKPRNTPVSIISRMIEELETEIETDSNVTFSMVPTKSFHECRPRTARAKSARPVRQGRVLVAPDSVKNEEPSSEAEAGSSPSSGEGLKKISENSTNHYSQSFSSEERSTEYSIVDKILSKIQYSIESESDEKHLESNEDYKSSSQEEANTETEESDCEKPNTTGTEKEDVRDSDEIIAEELTIEEVPEVLLEKEMPEVLLEKEVPEELEVEEELDSNHDALRDRKQREDSDERVSSVLLGVNPSITIDQASDDHFYK